MKVLLEATLDPTSRTSRKRSSDPLGARICLSPVHVRADTRRGHAAQHAKVAHVVREAGENVPGKEPRLGAHVLVDVPEAHVARERGVGGAWATDAADFKTTLALPGRANMPAFP